MSDTIITAAILVVLLIAVIWFNRSVGWG